MKDIKARLCVAVFTLLFAFSEAVTAGDIYVAAGSQTKGNGSKEQPFASLEAALREAREWRRLNDPRTVGGITIWVNDGLYRPSQTILVRPEDSGTAESPTRVKAVGDGAVFSGGISISGWKPAGKVNGLPNKVSHKLLVADAPRSGGKYFAFRQLWVNNHKAIRAESHDDQHLPRILNWDFEKGTATIPNVFPGFTMEPGMEFFIHQWWAIAQLRIQDATVSRDSIVLSFHEPERQLQNEHPWPKPWLSKEHGNSAFRLVNALQFLDQPGEWFLDEKNHKVYYYPRDGEDMKTATVTAPYLETIIQLQGTLENPISHVQFEGLKFQHSTWLRPHTHGHVALQAGMYFVDAYKLQKAGTPDKAGLENQAWVGRPGAAVQLKNTKYTSILNCSFTHLAATGLDYQEANFQDTLQGNVFQDIAGSGLLLGSFSDPEMEAHLPYLASDERRMTDGTYVANNLIQQVGNEDWGTVGIGAGFVRNLEIVHNELLELPYTGISLGWGWTPTVNSMKNNRVQHNKITRYGQYMYDVAGIYTLSAQPGTKIQYNVIDSIYVSPYAHIPDHWFYLYTDEGSAYMTVSDNWFPSNKILQNANGPSVEWKNNGPGVAEQLVAKAGFEEAYQHLAGARTPLSDAAAFNAYVPFTKPVFFQIYDPQRRVKPADVEAFFTRQGADASKLFRWKEYTVLQTTDELGKKLAGAWLANYPEVAYKVFNNLFYSFDKSRCAGTSAAVETDYVLLTAQLVDDKAKQEAYLHAHEEQYEKWPEVAKGFCQAGFEEVLLYRNDRQLMLYISFPKGQRFEDIDPLTLKDNPRVNEWNKLMGSYQEGIEGTAANETWIFYKK
ncbi:L-rhamnose mutarotase [Sphingobacterium paludis]|uniref:Parallel beta helix pectate lyase-like protein n=1 Tax=Sphingobacterium paludis TaxID=1476465 RepID=A0A4R7CSP4_9SPHI|nr:L-rhamnose mutarotase [Sphingobacterium paludis]TDS10282.1 parallel beta helix pectate lyase-like protein [Sphingobacterium paludis]